MNTSTDWELHGFLQRVGPEHMSLEELRQFRACGGTVPDGLMVEKQRAERTKRARAEDPRVEEMLARNELRGQAADRVALQVEEQIRANEVRRRRESPVRQALDKVRAQSANERKAS